MVEVIKVSILTQYKALFIGGKMKMDESGIRCFNPYSIQGIVHLEHLHSTVKTILICFNPYSIQGIVHLPSRGRGMKQKKNVSILTQYKALFIQTDEYMREKINVSILTQYKALFIGEGNMKIKIRFLSFNPYSIQGIVHLGKILMIVRFSFRFNPYSIQGIVHLQQ